MLNGVVVAIVKENLVTPCETLHFIEIRFQEMIACGNLSLEVTPMLHTLSCVDCELVNLIFCLRSNFGEEIVLLAMEDTL